MAAKLVIFCPPGCVICRSLAAAISHWLVYHSYVAQMSSTVLTGVPARLDGARLSAGSNNNAGTLAISSAARVMLHRSATLICLARVMVTLGGMAASAGCFSTSCAAATAGTSSNAPKDSRRALSVLGLSSSSVGTAATSAVTAYCFLVGCVVRVWCDVVSRELRSTVPLRDTHDTPIN